MKNANRIPRRTFVSEMGLSAAALCARSVWSQDSGAGDKPPNIVLIMTDQQNAEMMICTGNPWVKTPNMDRIAAAGRRFERAYCANPVCVPSRFGMFTGHMPSVIGLEKNGMLDKPLPEAIATNTMGALFRRAGYLTAYGGKVHLPGSQGQAVESEHAGIENYGFEEFLTEDYRGGLSEACVRFLDRKQDRPFLLVASFNNPHDICSMAGSSIKKQSAGKLRPRGDTKIPEGVSLEHFLETLCPHLPENYAVQEKEPDALVTDLFECAHPSRGYARRHWTDRDWRMYRWTYARLVEKVDRHIGRVLDALHHSGLEENTLVVFTSDHGDMNGAHRLEHKMVSYEEAIRVPFIIAGPGISKGGDVDRDHLVSTGLDLIPTLCDFAGVAIPAELPGRSIRELTRGSEAENWRESLVVENRNSRILQWDRKKYVVYGTGRIREQFVDLQEDPGELRNVAGDPVYLPQVEEGRRRLGAWYAAHRLTLEDKYVVQESNV